MNDIQLEKIKRRLGIDVEDDLEDELIEDLVNDAESYFKALVVTTEIDKKYHFIIENVVYKLYGRKGSEGVKTENVDGYSVTYEDWDDMFKPYRKILDKDFGLDGSLARKGKVKFL